MLCAMTAIALRAHTFNTVFSFDRTDGNYPPAAWSRPPMGFVWHNQLWGTNIAGTVFKMTPTGTLTTTYTFGVAPKGGYYPIGGLIQAINGDLYGTTEYGGAGDGTVFKITPSGALTTLYSFCAQSGCTDGEILGAGLIQATNGDFYGTTEYGGATTVARSSKSPRVAR